MIGVSEYLPVEYTGDVLNGLSDGNGYCTIEKGNTVIEYMGGFSEAAFNGYGELVLRDENESYTIKGNFEDGGFAPTYSEVISNLSSVGQRYGEFVISDQVADFIDKNEQVFLDDTIEITDIKEFSYKDFEKKRMQDEVGIVKLNLVVNQIFEDEWIATKTFDSDRYTSILATDNDYNYYVIYYWGTNDLHSGDRMTVYAVPVTTSSFENVSGGLTNNVVFIACRFE